MTMTINRPPPLPPTDLAGTKWVLSSYVANDEDVDAAAVAGARLRRGRQHVECDDRLQRVRRHYSQDGSNLSVELGPMTLIACTDDATTAQERAIVDGLPRVASFTASGQLALLDDNGVALLIYDPNTAGLEGTSWTATE